MDVPATTTVMLMAAIVPIISILVLAILKYRGLKHVLVMYRLVLLMGLRVVIIVASIQYVRVYATCNVLCTVGVIRIHAHVILTVLRMTIAATCADVSTTVLVIKRQPLAPQIVFATRCAHQMYHVLVIPNLVQIVVLIVLVTMFAHVIQIRHGVLVILNVIVTITADVILNVLATIIVLAIILALVIITALATT